MTKNEKAYNLIFNQLNTFTSYEDKHKYLEETMIDAGKHGKKSIKNLLNRYPEVSQSVNEHMLNVAMSEYGNPADEGFTFSKDMSNKKILDTLDSIAMNEAIIQNKYGGDKGYNTLHQEVLNKEASKKELKEEKKLLQKSIASRRKEFKETAVSAGPLFEFSNLVQQMYAGWTDIFAEEGMEKVERSNLLYDPENERFGLGPEFKAQQDRLGQVLNEIDLLSVHNKEYEQFKELDEMQNMRLNQLSSTIIDDLVSSGYASEKEIRTLLGE